MRSLILAVTLSLWLICMSFPAIAAEQLSPTGAGISAPVENALGFEDPFAEESANVQVSDPIEPFNRAMFWFNDKLYFYLLKPVARGYRFIVPEPVRISVGNFFSNLGTPVRFANSALQLKVGDAGIELTRFLLNTTFGVAGLFDFAKAQGMREKDEDFGQTLGRYGVGPGFYLVLPVFGPSNPRDAVGRVADYFIDPITSPYYVKLHWYESLALKTYDRVNFLSLDKDTYEGIKEDSLDPYLFIRNAYAQRRAALVAE